MLCCSSARYVLMPRWVWLPKSFTNMIHEIVQCSTAAVRNVGLSAQGIYLSGDSPVHCSIAAAMVEGETNGFCIA